MFPSANGRFGRRNPAISYRRLNQVAARLIKQGVCSAVSHGTEQSLREFIGSFVIAFGHSRFSRREVRTAGCASDAVVAPRLIVVTNTTELPVIWWHSKGVLAVLVVSKAVEVPGKTVVPWQSKDDR